MSRQILNKNYFSRRNNKKYMGSSQFKAFCECEAAALHSIKTGASEKPTKSMLIGSYVDAYFSGELDDFTITHPEIFTKSGRLLADFEHARYIISRIERDKMFMKYLNGGAQVIKTGTIAGVPFKIKIDSYHDGRAIVDLKIVRDFEPVWAPGKGKINFIEYWGYDIQAAIYQEIEGNKLPFFIAAATKEPEPDIDIFQIPQHVIDVAAEKVHKLAPHFQAVKTGIELPVRCGKCDYCKRTKKIERIRSMDELC
ncbi:MAG: PD-(D/E)XK nuclease-like domain-containing protein [Clostridia bacterium]|nr:PD-(D/E)XK nuclease-like domain-containing protein [Clostridia bacterium]